MRIDTPEAAEHAVPFPLSPSPFPRGFGIETFESLDAGAKRIAQRRYGVIEARAGGLVGVTLRPWPTLFSMRELLPLGELWRPAGEPDRVRLYYNQPRGHERFLALRYVAATPGTRYATLVAALRALDGVARLKQSDALLCDAANRRLSDRFLARMGWAPHAPGWRQRNYIKRFYGVYPEWASVGDCR
ncbi:MAG: hypothetical protein ACRCT8_06395 [Lacipirellulaceae bacterium]